MRSKWMLATLIGLSLAIPARAADEPKEDEDKPKAEETKKSPPMTENKGTQKQVEKLASRFNVPEKDVLALREKGLGWGEIRHALAISQKAGVPVSDVLKLRDSGMGWGRIARNYGFKLGEVTGKGRERPEGEDRGSGRPRGHQDERGGHGGMVRGSHGHGPRR